jgi:hypothetical protein
MPRKEKEKILYTINSFVYLFRVILRVCRLSFILLSAVCFPPLILFRTALAIDCNIVGAVCDDFPAVGRTAGELELEPSAVFISGTGINCVGWNIIGIDPEQL